MGTHTLNMEQTFSKSELVDGSKMNVSAVELWPTSAVQAVEMEIKSPLISSSKEYDYSSFSLYKETESKSNLSAGTIAGIVLGTIAGIILFLGSIILLIFAKATERWCFADDDYQNRDPQELRNCQKFLKFSKTLNFRISRKILTLNWSFI